MSLRRQDFFVKNTQTQTKETHTHTHTHTQNTHLMNWAWRCHLAPTKIPSSFVICLFQWDPTSKCGRIEGSDWRRRRSWSMKVLALAICLPLELERKRERERVCVCVSVPFRVLCPGFVGYVGPNKAGYKSPRLLVPRKSQ